MLIMSCYSTLGSLTCEEDGNLSTRDLGIIYVSSEPVAFKYFNVLVLNIAEKMLNFKSLKRIQPLPVRFKLI
jgi:hypothetical protein